MACLQRLLTQQLGVFSLFYRLLDHQKELLAAPCPPADVLFRHYGTLPNFRISQWRSTCYGQATLFTASVITKDLHKVCCGVYYYLCLTSLLWCTTAAPTPRKLVTYYKWRLKNAIGFINSFCSSSDSSDSSDDSDKTNFIQKKKSLIVCTARDFF